MIEDRVKFVEYIANLASEDGETALLLRQKPKTDADGNPIYHSDGVPQASFPAFLPANAKIKPGEAWYTNTGSFVVSRFEDGKPSAKRDNVDYVLFMMLDDIGTKSKTPPLDPTWVMETSEGSFQWGYAFSSQPTKGQFCAAINAIAEAGYTDPGATNPVRNCRIPGSVNLKQGRNAFQSRLVSFNPEREYTLEEICAALDVVPAEANTAEHYSIKIRDTGQDNVLAWLSDNGMVMTPVNPEGWHGIICPNSAMHTDSNVEARYKPLDRSFCCYHGHCADFKSAAFLAWVAENGGPTVSPGLRDELIAERMALVYEKIAPTTEFPDEAAIRVKEVERKEAGRIEKNDWFARYAYVKSDDSYFDMETRLEVPRHVFNALYRHVDCKSIHNSKQRVTASVFFDERRQDAGAPALEGITFAAGDTALMVRDGLVYGNKWLEGRPDMSGAAKVRDMDILPWIDHCKLLVAEAAELDHVWDVMAFKVQNPSVKINHAVLHGGDEGCGKDSMWAPFLWAIGGKHQRNRTIIDTGGIDSQWGYGLETEILVVNELQESEARERRAMANKMKPIIAAPPETLLVNRKGLHPYELLNRLQVLAFTNFTMPITLPSQDRRWFCLWSQAPIMLKVDADPLWNWYRASGYEKIAAWLHQRDVSHFSPTEKPPVTEWKLNMIEHGMSVAESYLVELMKRRIGPFAKGVVGGPFHKLCDIVALNHVPSGTKVPQAAMIHALKEAGWIDCGRIASVDYTSRKHIFIDPDMRKTSKSELRRMVETADTPAPPSMNIR